MNYYPSVKFSDLLINSTFSLLRTEYIVRSFNKETTKQLHILISTASTQQNW